MSDLLTNPTGIRTVCITDGDVPCANCYYYGHHQTDDGYVVQGKCLNCIAESEPVLVNITYEDFREISFNDTPSSYAEFLKQSCEFFIYHDMPPLITEETIML